MKIITVTILTTLLVTLALWLRAEKVWVTIQTENQRDCAALYMRQGDDIGAEHSQTVFRF